MNYFVFVVCGGKEYIEELNFSLKFLRHYSRYPIIVLTDSSRNEIKIDHDNIIDELTPLNYLNHQAHLYLETRLPHYVKPNEGDIFCYLDSDVIAISEEINEVFNQFIPPIRFAPDHCTIDYFSAGVMNCNCISNFNLIKEQYNIMQSFFPEPEISNITINTDREKLHLLFKKIKINPFASGFIGFKYFIKRYFSSCTNIILDKYSFNRKNKCWYNNLDQLIDYDYSFYRKKLWKKHGIRYKNARWENNKGQPLIPTTPKCHHLRQHIKKNYNIEINSDWRHWNGGVFLFNKQSIDFMNYWHKYTMSEFNNGRIKTYDDQGTLAVCAWQFGIQNMKPLSIKFNFITDFGNKNVQHSKNGTFTFNNHKSTFSPAFLHVYNNWGDEEWNIWKAVIEIGKKQSIL